MLQKFLLISCPTNLLRQTFLFHWILFYLLLIISLHSATTYAASIATQSFTSANPWQLSLSDPSYRFYFLRHYFLDLLNSSQPEFVQSMMNHHRLVFEVEQVRKKRNVEIFQDFISPMATIQPIRCFDEKHNEQDRSTFQWTITSIDSIKSIELIYHLKNVLQPNKILPIKILLRDSNRFTELAKLDTSLRFDSSRDFYYFRMDDQIRQLKSRSILIEAAVDRQICQTSQAYLIVSFHKIPNIVSLSPRQSSESTCSIKSVSINFEELGLAYFIIRPVQYRFTYCDGTCPFVSRQNHHHLSFYEFFRSFLHEVGKEVGSAKCVASQYKDDYFLLRHANGTLNIFPIHKLLTTRCACQ